MQIPFITEIGSFLWISVCSFSKKILLYPKMTQIYSETHNVLKLRVILLIQPAKCWDYGPSPSGVFGFILFHNSEVLEILHRH